MFFISSLLEYCHKSGIKAISSMGAGAKCDPTRILVGDISMWLVSRKPLFTLTLPTNHLTPRRNNRRRPFQSHPSQT